MSGSSRWEKAGVGIFLDNHRNTAGDGAARSGLVCRNGSIEQDWTDTRAMLPLRYTKNAPEPGLDLSNWHNNASWAGCTTTEVALEVDLSTSSDRAATVDGETAYRTAVGRTDDVVGSGAAWSSRRARR